MPSHLNDSPFANSISQKNKVDNSFSKKSLDIPAEALEVLTENQATALIERGITGDNLLNARDLAETILSVGGEITENGEAIVYHGTTAENAKKINSTGKMIGKEDGLFFSTKKDGIVLDYGDAVVKAKIPIEKLILDDIFDDEAHLRLPVRRNAFTNIDVLQESKADDGVRFALKKGGETAAEKKLLKEVERAKEKYERATETKEAQLKAEYTTDTVFSQKSVKDGFDSVSEVKGLPAKVREGIARDLWLELQMSGDEDVRNTFILKYSVKLYDAIRRNDPDAYDNMTLAERDALTAYT